MMDLEALTWNMAHRPEAWDWLFQHSDNEGLQIALLQEAPVPKSLPPGVRIHPSSDDLPAWRIGAKETRGRNWRSAIVCLDPALTFEPVSSKPIALAENTDDLPESHPGQWAAASLSGPAMNTDMTVISLYGIWNDVKNYAVPAVHRAISDFAPLYWGRQHVLLAGDLNVWHGYGEWSKGYATVFDRLTAEGFDLLGPFGAAPLEGCPCASAECRHLGTFRKGDQRIWQTDYVLGKGLRGVACSSVLSSWDVSDHCAIRISTDEDRR
jgi:hypothetical protein